MSALRAPISMAMLQKREALLDRHRVHDRTGVFDRVTARRVDAVRADEGKRDVFRIDAGLQSAVELNPHRARPFERDRLTRQHVSQIRGAATERERAEGRQPSPA